MLDHIPEAVNFENLFLRDPQLSFHNGKHLKLYRFVYLYSADKFKFQVSPGTHNWLQNLNWNGSSQVAIPLDRKNKTSGRYLMKGCATISFCH